MNPAVHERNSYLLRQGYVTSKVSSLGIVVIPMSGVHMQQSQTPKYEVMCTRSSESTMGLKYDDVRLGAPWCGPGLMQCSKPIKGVDDSLDERYIFQYVIR